MYELIYGLKGDGKSYACTRLIIGILVSTRYYVCTNLPLKLPELAAEVERQSHFPVNLSERLRILTQDEVCRFWRHPAPNLDFPVDGKMVDIKMMSKDGVPQFFQVPDYSCIPDGTWPGTAFFLDEAHIPFSAYEFAQVSKEMTWACSQDRKLGFEVYFATQNPEKMAKALRRDIHKFTRVRNLGNQKTLGFVIPGRFRVATYPEMPSKSGEVVCEDSSFYRLDPAIANCYDTNAGVGLTAKVFHVERHSKGLRLWNLFWMVPLFFGVILAAVFGVGALMSKVPAILMGTAGRVTSHIVPISGPRVATSAPAKAPSAGAPAIRPVEKETAAAPLAWSVRWYNPGLQKWQLVLTDGRRFTLGDGHFTGASGDACYVDGQCLLPVQTVQKVVNHAGKVTYATAP